MRGLRTLQVIGFAGALLVVAAAACSPFGGDPGGTTTASDGGTTTASDGGTTTADGASTCAPVFDAGFLDPAAWTTFSVGGTLGPTAIDAGVLEAQLTLPTAKDTGSAAIQRILPFAPGDARDVELGFRLRVDKQEMFEILGCQLRFVDETAASYLGKTIALNSGYPGQLALASANFGFDGGSSPAVPLTGFTYSTGVWTAPVVMHLHFESATNGTVQVVSPVATSPMNVAIPATTTRLRIVCGIIYADTTTAATTDQLAIDGVHLSVCP